MITEHIQNEIIDNFNMLDDDIEMSLNYLMELGEGLDPFDEELRVDDNIIKGCQSKVYFVTIENSDGTLTFHANSDALIVQGLIAILLKVYSNKNPREILRIDTDFLNKIGLDSHLSPTRKNGLFSMINKIKTEAEARVTSFD